MADVSVMQLMIKLCKKSQETGEMEDLVTEHISSLS